jgi:DNA-directed RNA polymerase specialized sigma24 family protein
VEAVMSPTADATEFEKFADAARPRLTRAFVSTRGLDGAADAAAEALAYAFEHWDEVRALENPVGLLYRVGQSRTRPRRTPPLPAPRSVGLPDIEPRLVPALMALPQTQRTAVWLVHACQWRYSEVAEALGTSVSMVGNHVSRALAHLREHLEVDTNA